MMKICPRCKQHRKERDFLSFNKSRVVKCCKICRDGAKISYAKSETLKPKKPNRKKTHKKKMKQLDEELNDISIKLATVKKLEKQYREKLWEIQREYANHILNTRYIEIGGY